MTGYGYREEGKEEENFLLITFDRKEKEARAIALHSERLAARLRAVEKRNGKSEANKKKIKQAKRIICSPK